MPKHIDPRSTRGEDGLDAHAGQVIQLGYESSKITAEPKIRFSPIPFERGPKVIVICWVPVGELVHENRVVRKAPVVRRWMVACWHETGVIVQWRLGVLVCVQVVLGVSFVVGSREGGGCEGGEP